MTTKIQNASLSGCCQLTAIMGRTYEEAQKEAQRLGVAKLKFQTWNDFLIEFTVKNASRLDVLVEASDSSLVCTRDMLTTKLLIDHMKEQSRLLKLPNLLLTHDDLRRTGNKPPMVLFLLYSMFIVQDLETEQFYRWRNRNGSVDILPPKLADRFLPYFYHGINTSNTPADN